ncbi:TIGR04283 family arsenosugar biosynthesis glycosyltransferase [bacterium]|nr:TIGR04283 family arsenosugar biosynthesis glycosyltransferase [bacterium]
MLISIIIPTLNEEANIESVLQSLIGFSNIEILVSDGGSSDRTCGLIGSFLLKYPFIQLIHSSRGRAVQLNAGAKQASGEWLIFLHADTIIPEKSWTNFCTLVGKGIAIQSGSFLFQVASDQLRYRLMEKLVNIRTRVLKLPYGDQAIFVRKDLFLRMQGYREDYPLMEDVEFVRQLQKEKGFTILQSPVITSPRRHESDGFFKRITYNFLITILYRLGIHPKYLVKYY